MVVAGEVGWIQGKNVVVVVVEPQASTVFWVLPEPCFLSFRDHPSQLQSLLGCSAVTHTLQGRACTLCCPFRTHTISRTHGPSAQTLYDKVVGTTGPEVGLCRYNRPARIPRVGSPFLSPRKNDRTGVVGFAELQYSTERHE